MLDKNLASIFDDPAATLALRDFLAFVDNYPSSGRLNPEVDSAAAYVATLDQTAPSRFVHALNCDWEPILRDFYGSSSAVEQSRRKLIAGLTEAAKAKQDWDVSAAFGCLAAMVENPGINWPNFPHHFMKIADILGFVLAAGIRMPSEGKYEILRGRIELYFKGFADGDPVVRQVNELFSSPHDTFRKTPEAPFADPKFRRFLRFLVEEPNLESMLRGAFDRRNAIAKLESDYLAWEELFGAYRWYELKPPAQTDPLPEELCTLAQSLSGGRPTASWFNRASDALDRDEILRERLELLLSMLGTRDFAARSEPLWHSAKPALYLYALFRHYEGGTDPIGASRFVLGKLRRIVNDGMFYDPHVGPTKSGTYRNPLSLSQENTPLIKAACWSLSLIDDDHVAARLGEVAMSLGTQFDTPGRGRYLRSLAGCSAAIGALKIMRVPSAKMILSECREALDDSRLLELF